MELEIMGILKNTNDILSNSKERVKVEFTNKTNYPYMYGPPDYMKIDITCEECDYDLIHELCGNIDYAVYHSEDLGDGLKKYSLGVLG